MKRRVMVRTVAALMVAFAVSSCSNDTSTAPAKQAPGDVSGEVTVFAASSLTESFGEIAAAFEKEHPRAKVTVNFGASSALVKQVQDGAPVDLVATADTADLQKLIDAKLVGDSTIFAKNQLEIIVPPDNPAGIATLADLAEPDVKVALCAEQVPCGKFAKQTLATAGLNVTPVTLEENVKGVVTKVTLGEVDAGIVYLTDVLAAGTKAVGIAIPTDQNAVASYPVAVATAAPNKTAANAFAAFVSSPAAQKILGERGFSVR